MRLKIPRKSVTVKRLPVSAAYLYVIYTERTALTSTPKATISILPPEIIAKILIYLQPNADCWSCDTQNLSNVRLGCRAFSFAATPLLFEVFPFWLEESSLQILTKVSNHPVIGQCVKKLQCGTERFHRIAC